MCIQFSLCFVKWGVFNGGWAILETLDWFIDCLSKNNLKINYEPWLFINFYFYLSANSVILTTCIVFSSFPLKMILNHLTFFTSFHVPDKIWRKKMLTHFRKKISKTSNASQSYLKFSLWNWKLGIWQNRFSFSLHQTDVKCLNC